MAVDRGSCPDIIDFCCAILPAIVAGQADGKLLNVDLYFLGLVCSKILVNSDLTTNIFNSKKWLNLV